jgi:hypothetical protein
VFSDRFIKTKIIACLVCVGAASLYSGHVAPAQFLSMGNVIAHPQLYQNVVLGCQVCKIKSVSGGRMTFHDGASVYSARLESGLFSRDCAPGGKISMSGTVRDSVLVVKFYHVHKNWLIKIFVSLIALALTLLYCAWKLLPQLQNPWNVLHQEGGGA